MFYFDSYAFIEIFRANKRYACYQEVPMVTSRLNLMEVHYWLLNRFGRKIADSFYDDTVQNAIEIPDAIIKEAMAFRFLHKRRNLSYIDCIGYVFARANGLQFLTGDMQFKEMESVKFVH